MGKGFAPVKVKPEKTPAYSAKLTLPPMSHFLIFNGNASATKNLVKVGQQDENG